MLGKDDKGEESCKCDQVACECWDIGLECARVMPVLLQGRDTLLWRERERSIIRAV